MSAGPELRVFADAAAAASAAADFIAGQARTAVRARGRFSAAMSGGRTPALMFDALARADLPWQQVQLLQVDERVAPAGDPARNLNALLSALVDPGPLPRANLHPMPVESPSPEQASADYGQRLREVAGDPPALDLVHLGLGDDGHTASLVPGDEALDVAGEDVTLSGHYQGHRRMTLTFDAINRAHHRLWLVTGGAKAAMLERLRAGDESIPAGRVMAARAIVFCDRAAAGE